MIYNSSIEEKYKLEKIESKRGEIVITQSRNYIFYYEYTKKTNSSKVYKCSFYRDKIYPCKAFVILNSDQSYDQNNYNLEHSGHSIKSEQIKTLFENKEINNIINANSNIFSLNSTKIKNIMSSKIDITETKKDNLKHNIYNALKKAQPEEPKNISDIEITDNNFIDSEKENIVIYKDLNILFLSKNELAKIAYINNKDLFLDATFKVCNKLFSQLLIIRVYNEQFNEFFTIAFIYMTSKSELLYKRALSSFKNFILENNNISDNDIIFKNIHIDMELALSNAVKSTFNFCSIKYCYFHFGQAINRHINNNAYFNLFNDNLKAKELIFSLKALAHIRTEFVLSVFYSLEDEAKSLNIPLVNQFYDYFKNEYINLLDYNSWNYYKERKHFTNNCCEAYHNKLNKIIGMKKPHFWFSINIIKNELILFKNKYYNLIANNGPINNQHTGVIDRILNLVNYNDVQFNNLRLSYEQNIEDFSAPIIVDEDEGIDLVTYQIYNNYWINKVKILSKYM